MQWAIYCSEHVISLISEKIDERLLDALSIEKEWLNNKVATGKAMKASLLAHAVARETADPIVKAIARSIGQTVATAHMADHSLGGAFYTLKAVKLAHQSVNQEKKWQQQRLEELSIDLKKIVQDMREKKELDRRV